MEVGGEEDLGKIEMVVRVDEFICNFNERGDVELALAEKAQREREKLVETREMGI